MHRCTVFENTLKMLFTQLPEYSMGTTVWILGILHIVTGYDKWKNRIIETNLCFCATENYYIFFWFLLSCFKHHKAVHAAVTAVLMGNNFFFCPSYFFWLSLSLFQGWLEQQTLPVQPPWQHWNCWGWAEECPPAPLRGHPAGGSHMTNWLSLLSLTLEECVMWPSLSQVTRVKHHLSDSKRTQGICNTVSISKQTIHNWAIVMCM